MKAFKGPASTALLAFVVLALPTCCVASFLWFEAAPERDDPCTITQYGLAKERVYVDVHPDPTCSHGGLLWFATWGRIHGHFSLDNTTESNFRLCFTGGLSNAIFLWYNYRDKYWEPLGFPGYQGLLPENDTCRYSHRGILDMFFESPWGLANYVSFLTWEVTRMPAGWTDEEHAEDEDIITIFDKKEAPPEKEEGEEEEGSFQDIMTSEKEKGIDK